MPYRGDQGKVGGALAECANRNYQGTDRPSDDPCPMTFLP